MTKPPIVHAPSPKARAPAQARAILRSLSAKVLTYFARHEVAHLRAMSDHLLEMAQTASTQSAGDGYRLRSVSFLMDKQAAVPSSLYQDALKDTLHDAVQALLDPDLVSSSGPASDDDAMDGMSLTLIDVSEMDQLLSIDQVSQRFNNHYEARLAPLTQRLGMLVAGQVLGLSSNPFRPEVLIRGLLAAWKKAGFDEQVCKDLLHSLVPQHAIDLAPLYDDMTATLSQAGVAVKTSHRIRKAAEGESGFAGASDFTGFSASQPVTGSSDFYPSGQSGFPASASAPLPSSDMGSLEAPTSGRSSAYGRLAPLGHSLVAQARQFLHSLGFGSDAQIPPATQVVYTPVDPGLLGYLADLQVDAGAAFVDNHAAVEDGSHNVLRRMRDQAQIQQANEIDRGTVDALAEVFDYVFADPAIAPQLKVIIGRLQIPVLKAAMIDREFFHSAEHPARRLIDALAKAAVTWNAEQGEQDPLYQQIEQTVQRALSEFEDDLALFGQLLLEFDEFIKQTETLVQQHIEPVADAQKVDEALLMARVHADDIIHGRINAIPEATPLAPLLLPFLTDQWRDVLAQAWMVVRAEPERWNEALSTADKLIWSTQPQPPVAVERRQRTADLTPRPGERRQLMRVLPELIRNIERGLDAINWTGRPRAEFMHGLMELHMQAVRTAPPSPEELEQRVREALAADVAMRALEERRSQAKAAPQDDAEVRAKAFARGMWFDYLNERGQLHRCRLSWISPKRTRMLFTNREGFEAFVQSEREVAELLRQGRLTEIDQAPIVGRALEQILASAA